MTEQIQEAKANPAAQKAKAKSHPSGSIQTSSEIISVDEPENALPEVSLADLPQLLQTACAKAGWNSLMPVQSRALPYLLEGRDLMVQSRTGSGKTGTYLLPLMARLNPAMPAVQALILVPTRELAVQVEQEAKTLFKGSGFTVTAVYGGVGYGKQMDALRQGVSVVVGTPGRVLDHLLRRTLSLDHISALIFDEADRMLSIGFYPDMKEIQRYLPKTSIHAMLFSATYPPHVLKLAGEFLTDPQMLSLSTTQIHVAEVQHLYCECKGMEKDRTLIKILEVENPASAIIFCNTKATVHFVTAVLQGFGFNADELSADLSQSRREDVLSGCAKAAFGSSSPRTWPHVALTFPNSPMCFSMSRRMTGNPTSTGQDVPDALEPPVWSFPSSTSWKKWNSSGSPSISRYRSPSTWPLQMKKSPTLLVCGSRPFLKPVSGSSTGWNVNA